MHDAPRVVLVRKRSILGLVFLYFPDTVITRAGGLALDRCDRAAQAAVDARDALRTMDAVMCKVLCRAAMLSQNNMHMNWPCQPDIV